MDGWMDRQIRWMDGYRQGEDGKMDGWRAGKQASPCPFHFFV